MWGTIVMILIIILFFISLDVFKEIEGFENPYIVSQEQQGDIATFRRKLSKITMSDASLTLLQEKITDLSNKTSKLQMNLPDKRLDKYAPK